MMNEFNQANNLIRDILVSEDFILEIGMDDYFIDGWLYQSNYPLEVPSQSMMNKYRFIIQLFRFHSETNSLKLVELVYALSEGAIIDYVVNPELSDYENQLGKNFVQKEVFLSGVKPLILAGFREISCTALVG